MYNFSSVSNVWFTAKTFLYGVFVLYTLQNFAILFNDWQVSNFVGYVYWKYDNLFLNQPC